MRFKTLYLFFLFPFIAYAELDTASKNALLSIDNEIQYIHDNSDIIRTRVNADLPIIRNDTTALRQNLEDWYQDYRLTYGLLFNQLNDTSNYKGWWYNIDNNLEEASYQNSISALHLSNFLKVPQGDEKSPYYSWNEFSFQTVEQNAQQLENLYSISKAATNFYNGFFNKNNTTTVAFERPVSSFDIYNGQQNKNFANDYDNPITHAVNQKIIPQNYSFMDFMADYSGGHMRWLSQMFKQQLVLRDNIKAYRSSFKTYDNNFDKYAFNNTNLLATINESIKNISSNNIPSIEKRLYKVSSSLGQKFGKDYSNDDILTESFNSSGNFYKDVILLLGTIQEQSFLETQELSSLVTNLQEIVASTTEWSEDKKHEIYEKIEDESTDLKSQLDDAESELKYEDYLAFKNEFANFKSLSLGYGTSEEPVEDLVIMDRFYYSFGDMEVEVDSISVSWQELRDIAQYVRFFTGFMWWSLTFLIVKMIYNYFIYFASKFVEYTSKVQ